MFEKFKKMNMKLSFPEEKQNLTDLFNCPKCGFHQKVIAKIWIKGFQDDFIIQCKIINPNHEKVVLSLGKSLKRDGKMLEELICGICGSNGQMLPVTDEILNIYGMSGRSDSSPLLNSRRIS